MQHLVRDCLATQHVTKSGVPKSCVPTRVTLEVHREP